MFDSGWFHSSVLFPPNGYQTTIFVPRAIEEFGGEFRTVRTSQEGHHYLRTAPELQAGQAERIRTRTLVNKKGVVFSASIHRDTSSDSLESHVDVLNYKEHVNWGPIPFSMRRHFKTSVQLAQQHCDQILHMLCENYTQLGLEEFEDPS